MTDYTEAALREATVRLADGSEWTVHFVPAGTDGWNVPVIRAYDYTDDTMHWDIDGTAISADADIVEIEVAEDAGWDSQRASFTMTAEEATMLKEFLISKGY